MGARDIAEASALIEKHFAQVEFSASQRIMSDRESGRV